LLCHNFTFLFNTTNVDKGNYPHVAQLRGYVAKLRIANAKAFYTAAASKPQILIFATFTICKTANSTWTHLSKTINSRSVTIPGTKRIKYLEENIASENIRLTAEDLKSIEAIMPAGIVSGTRYPERFLNTLNK
jgi:hypothetical protein